MTEEEFEFILTDRIAKIKAINEQINLLEKSYISYSGGKDSCILSKLLDIVFPNNTIPRVVANTGLEYFDMLKFIKKNASIDNRIIILNQTRNIPKTLQQYGYPFKSKDFSALVLTYYNMKRKGLEVCENYKKRIRGDSDTYQPVPKVVRYIFSEPPSFKISDYCCIKIKEDLLNKWAKLNNRPIAITGIRKDEGGRRGILKGCLGGKGTKFHPLSVVSDEWEDMFIKKYNVELSPLYKEPYNFKRSGCKGCPYSIELQQNLNKIYKINKNEYFQIISLWRPVYDEYIKHGYRLQYYPHIKENTNEKE